MRFLQWLSYRRLRSTLRQVRAQRYTDDLSHHLLWAWLRRQRSSAAVLRLLEEFGDDSMPFVLWSAIARVSHQFPLNRPLVEHCALHQPLFLRNLVGKESLQPEAARWLLRWALAHLRQAAGGGIRPVQAPSLPGPRSRKQVEYELAHFLLCALAKRKERGAELRELLLRELENLLLPPGERGNPEARGLHLMALDTLGSLPLTPREAAHLYRRSGGYQVGLESLFQNPSLPVECALGAIEEFRIRSPSPGGLRFSFERLLAQREEWLTHAEIREFLLESSQQEVLRTLFRTAAPHSSDRLRAFRRQLALSAELGYQMLRQHWSELAPALSSEDVARLLSSPHPETREAVLRTLPELLPPSVRSSG